MCLWVLRNFIAKYESFNWNQLIQDKMVDILFPCFIGIIFIFFIRKSKFLDYKIYKSEKLSIRKYEKYYRNELILILNRYNLNLKYLNHLNFSGTICISNFSDSIINHCFQNMKPDWADSNFWKKFRFSFCSIRINTTFFEIIIIKSLGFANRSPKFSYHKTWGWLLQFAELRSKFYSDYIKILRSS